MEDEELDYNSVGMKNGAIDKIKGVTGTVAPKSSGKVSSADQSYYKGIQDYIKDRPSQSYGGRGMQGANLKKALKAGNYEGAANAMKAIRSAAPEKFKSLNKIGISRSGFQRGGRFSDKKSNYTGKLSDDMKSRTDSTFDPQTQKTSTQTYKFN
jgi:hypothetical protein